MNYVGRMYKCYAYYTTGHKPVQESVIYHLTNHEFINEFKDTTTICKKRGKSTILVIDYFPGPQGQ